MSGSGIDYRPGVPSGIPTVADSRCIINVSYDGANNVEYKGMAAPGTGDADAGWFIQKYYYDGAGNFLKARFAGGSDKFENIWDNRASLIYS